MKKRLKKRLTRMKKIITFTLILCMSAALLASCGGSSSDSGDTASQNSISENPGNVYRVIVRDETGAGIQGVSVQLCSDSMCLMGETDSVGIAVFEDQEEGAYTVHVRSVPEGYADDPAEYDAPETYGDVSITLKPAG